jgi:ABC-type multidrug transport system permease subunit
MQMSIFSVAFVFTNYKEKGVLKRLIATPMRPITFVTANVLTRLIVSFLQTAVFILVGVFFPACARHRFLLAHSTHHYSWIRIMFLGLGFTISGIRQNSQSPFQLWRT